jgi:hypothetical protein
MKHLVALLVTAACITFFAPPAKAQRDYFTPEEVELIRDAQQIDLRIGVLVHAMDRRFAAANINVNAPSVKEKGDWGPGPTGTHLELLIDVQRILQKAVDDIDGLAERPDSGLIEDPLTQKKSKSYAQVFPAAVRNLASAAERYRAPLKSELDKSNDPAEKGTIMNSLDLCDEIIAAVPKLPAQQLPPKKAKN